MNALTLENVSYTYPGGTSPVVKNATYGFEAGKLYAVVGPSGSGKSTLLSMLAGLAIARSLCSGAPVLLADEPTGNLDGENTRIVMEILRRLAHEEGRCVIVVTHDPEVADTADLILRMKDGALTAE